MCIYIFIFISCHFDNSFGIRHLAKSNVYFLHPLVISHSFSQNLEHIFRIGTQREKSRVEKHENMKQVQKQMTCQDFAKIIL